MKRLLQVLALILAVGSASCWVATGAHRGWTQTRVPKKILDDVTGIEAVTYEKRLVIGVDLLGAGFVAAVALAGASFLFHKQIHQRTP